MKYRTTRKAIVQSSANIVCAGYDELQHLLRYTAPVAYTCGVYGWNFDVYKVHGVTICTGYRNMPGRMAKNISLYEERARKIVQSKVLADREKKVLIEETLLKFCEQA